MALTWNRDPLMVDVSSWNVLDPRMWSHLFENEEYRAVMLKVSEGIGGSGAEWERKLDGWLREQWPAVGWAGTWANKPVYRGGYHFLLANGHGKEQADHYLRTVETMRRLEGHPSIRNLVPAVDVEEGSGNDARLKKDGAQIVWDTALDFSLRIEAALGRKPILYAGWWLASLGNGGFHNADALWYASYTGRLATETYGQMGWPLNKLWAWQYAGGYINGKPTARLAGYPDTTPLGPMDISAVVMRDGLEKMTL